MSGRGIANVPLSGKCTADRFAGPSIPLDNELPTILTPAGIRYIVGKMDKGKMAQNKDVFFTTGIQGHSVKPAYAWTLFERDKYGSLMLPATAIMQALSYCSREEIESALIVRNEQPTQNTLEGSNKLHKSIEQIGNDVKNIQHDLDHFRKSLALLLLPEYKGTKEPIMVDFMNRLAGETILGQEKDSTNPEDEKAQQASAKKRPWADFFEDQWCQPPTKQFKTQDDVDHAKKLNTIIDFFASREDELQTIMKARHEKELQKLEEENEQQDNENKNTQVTLEDLKNDRFTDPTERILSEKEAKKWEAYWKDPNFKPAENQKAMNLQWEDPGCMTERDEHRMKIEEMVAELKKVRGDLENRKKMK